MQAHIDPTFMIYVIVIARGQGFKLIIVMVIKIIFTCVNFSIITFLASCLVSISVSV